MKRIVILISGRGSNLEALAEAIDRGSWPARIEAVIANRPDAAGLETARRRGLKTEVVDHTAFADRAAFDVALQQAIDAHAPDWVLLAGFMRVLGESFVRHYEGRLVNIHPSLLPAFAGLHTHRRALQAGVKFAGATVHFVTPELDHGPILAQAVVPVQAQDDEASLARRVLAAEHRLYPRVLGWLVHERVRLQSGPLGPVVRQLDDEPQGEFWPDPKGVA